MLTDRDFDVLVSVVKFYTLTRAQISRLHFPTDDGGRMTRKRTQHLVDLGLVAKTKMQVTNPDMGFGQPAPVFFPTANGVALVAERTGDDAWRTASCQSPNWTHLYHYCEIADQHILIDRAAAAVPGLTIATWYGEYSVLNPDESAPHKRFTLFSLLTEQPRLICKPDAAFLLDMAGFRKIYYLETDRDTTKSADRVAAQKCGGYAGLLAHRGHARHFPAANVDGFTVLVVAPTDKRRDALRKAFAEHPGTNLYKFAARPELTPENLFRGPVWRNGAGEVVALLKGGDA